MLDAIQSKLETEYHVKTVIDFAAISKQRSERPLMIYLMLLQETVKNTDYTGVTVSSVDSVIGVVIAQRSAKDPHGADHREQMDGVRKSIRTLLAGWAPDTDYEPLVRGNGRLMQFENKTVYWLDVFSTKYTEEARHHQ